jgi:NTP pyrophosphatase (non-canonical NTP hydrolase)
MTEQDFIKNELSISLNAVTTACHELAKKSGWWNGNPNIGEKLCLVHSEVSEAMEGHRKDLMDDHLPHRQMIEVELADALIRIHDLAGYLELDLGGAVKEKLEYNQQRSDHKLENRAKEGGKKY